MVAKGHFSWCTFLNVWKCLLFAGDGFAGAWLIDLAMLSIIHKTFLQMAPWFLSIRLAALLKFWRNFFWFKSFAHVQSTSKRNCASFLSFVNTQRIQSDLGKFPHKCYSYSQEKSKRQCLLFFFSWMKASETFERLSVFAERAIDFMIFRNKYGREVMAGMYAISNCTRLALSYAQRYLKVAQKCPLTWLFMNTIINSFTTKQQDAGMRCEE